MYMVMRHLRQYDFSQPTNLALIIFTTQASMRSGQSGYEGYGEADFDIDDSTQEFYYGEWKNDKRNG